MPFIPQKSQSVLQTALNTLFEKKYKANEENVTTAWARNNSLAKYAIPLYNGSGQEVKDKGVETEWQRVYS